MSRSYSILLQGSQQVPGVTTVASGYGAAVFNSLTSKLTYTMVVSGLDWGAFLGQGAETASTADDVTAFHFHTALSGVNGGVIFDLPSGDVNNFTVSAAVNGSRTITGIWEMTDPTSIAAYTATFDSGVVGSQINIYANIHTVANGGGELRGQFITMADDAANTINGNAQNNILAGADGNDTLNGSGGNDILYGGSGADILYGGDNDDTLYGDDVFAMGISRVSTSAAGIEGNGNSSRPVFSPDGRKVAFESTAGDLVAGDTNGVTDVFLKDLDTGAITVLSRSVSGVFGNGLSGRPVFSPDGTKVAFFSEANNLFAGDNNNARDIFIKDLNTGAITVVSRDAAGVLGDASTSNPYSNTPVFSPDGSKVLFQSAGANLSSYPNPGDFIFIKDLNTGAISLVSSDASGVGAQGFSNNPIFSPDGTKVAFETAAENLLAGDYNSTIDIYIKDLISGTITRVSLSSTGVQGNNSSHSPVFSPDGSKIFFYSYASNFVAGDTNGSADIFVKDLNTGVISLISTNQLGIIGNNNSYLPIISPDGSSVIFSSAATNFVAGDSNVSYDIYVKNLSTGAITLVSTSALGITGNANSSAPVFSPDGSNIAFYSYASNLVAGDTNGFADIFIANIDAHFSDTLYGGAGNDTLDGGTGVDFLVGGTGNDIYIADDVNDTIIEQVNEGTDIIRSGQTSTYMFNANLENMELLAGGVTGWGNAANNVMTGNTAANTFIGGLGADTLNGLDGNDVLIGDAGNDILNGGNNDDQLWGGLDNDQLNGGDGIDTLSGGAGTNTLSGGLGDDVYIVDSATDTIVEAAGAGTGFDTAWISVSGMTLSNNIEVAVLTGAASSITGSSGNETIIANGALSSTIYGAAGADTLWGSGFSDALIGGTGNDALSGLGGADIFAFNAAGFGFDIVNDFSGIIGGQGDRINLAGMGIANFGQLSLTQHGVGTTINFGADAILLWNIAATNLRPGDFIF